LSRKIEKQKLAEVYRGWQILKILGKNQLIELKNMVSI